VSVYKNRLNGYLEALTKHNIPIDSELIIEQTIHQETGRIAAEKISKMNPMPDGIFAASDFSALGAMIRLKELGIDLPRQIAVVGYANEPFDTLITPCLSSVDQHSMEIGRNAVNLFLENMQNPELQKIPKRIILHTDLCIRDSSLKITSSSGNTKS
jgi:LacI family transcriptional regulator